MILFTTPLPVSGRSQRSTILCALPLATCSIITITRLAPCTRSIAPPMPLTILPGIIQFARSPCSRNLHRAEHGEIDVAAANHAERKCGIEERRAGQYRYRLLAGVDQIGIFLAFVRIGAHAEDAVLALQRHGDAGGHVVRNQRRQTDAEVDVLSVSAVPARRAQPAEFVVSAISAFLVVDAFDAFTLRTDLDDALHEDAGQVDVFGIDLTRVRPALRFRRS